MKIIATKFYYLKEMGSWREANNLPWGEKIFDYLERQAALGVMAQLPSSLL